MLGQKSFTRRAAVSAANARSGKTLPSSKLPTPSACNETQKLSGKSTGLAGAVLRALPRIAGGGRPFSRGNGVHVHNGGDLRRRTALLAGGAVAGHSVCVPAHPDRRRQNRCRLRSGGGGAKGIAAG